MSVPVSVPSADTDIRRDIANIALPVSLETVFQLALGFIDQVIVGVLGPVAIAAVGLSNSILWIGIFCLSTLGAGAAILVARAHGGGRGQSVSRVSGTATVLAAAAALLVSVPLALVAVPLLNSLGTAPDVAHSASMYFPIVVLTLPLISVSSVLSGVLRSMGQARAPMVVTIISVPLNTLFAYLLVFGVGPLPALGVAGAAIGTFVAQTVRVVLLVWTLYGGRPLARWELPVTLADWRSTSWELLRLTLPLTATELFWSGGTFLYTLLFTWIGTTALAASQITNSLEGVFFVASVGLMAAATTLIGQAIGRGDSILAQERGHAILRIGIITGLGFGLLYIATIAFLPLFYPNVPSEVLSIASWGIVINGAFQVVKVRNMILGAGVLPSGGDTKGVLLGDATSAFLVGLPIACLLAFVLGMGVWGVFWARIVEETFKLGVFTWRASRLSWAELAARAHHSGTAE